MSLVVKREFTAQGASFGEAAQKVLGRISEVIFGVNTESTEDVYIPTIYNNVKCKSWINSSSTYISIDWSTTINTGGRFMWIVSSIPNGWNSTTGIMTLSIYEYVSEDVSIYLGGYPYPGTYTNRLYICRKDSFISTGSYFYDYEINASIPLATMGSTVDNNKIVLSQAYMNSKVYKYLFNTNTSIADFKNIGGYPFFCLNSQKASIYDVETLLASQ